MHPGQPFDCKNTALGRPRGGVGPAGRPAGRAGWAGWSQISAELTIEPLRGKNSNPQLNHHKNNGFSDGPAEFGLENHGFLQCFRGGPAEFGAGLAVDRLRTGLEMASHWALVKWPILET